MCREEGPAGTLWEAEARMSGAEQARRGMGVQLELTSMPDDMEYGRDTRKPSHTIIFPDEHCHCHVTN